MFRFGSPAVVEDHGESTGKVGDILQRENYPNWGHNDQHDQEGSNGSYGVVRMGVDASLEEPLPSNRSESRNRLPSHYGRSMELDTKSMVEVSNGQTRAPHQHINSIRENLKSLPLGKISDRTRSAGRRNDDHGEESSQKHTGGMCGDGAYPQGEAHPILDANDKGDCACENQPGGVGDFESCCDVFSRGSSIEASVDGEMEVEGDGASFRC